MRICDLKNKEVINSNDCKILGFVVDIDVDLYTGRVISIIVPGPGRVFSFFGRENEYVIPYECKNNAPSPNSVLGASSNPLFLDVIYSIIL